MNLLPKKKKLLFVSIDAIAVISMLITPMIFNQTQ